MVEKNVKETVRYGEKSDLMRQRNMRTVLNLIRNKKEITRADIIRKTGLSAPTITRIVESLLNKNLIKVMQLGPSNGGRPPEIITFDSKNNYVIGIDIGATFIRAALSNWDGEFIYEVHISTNSEGRFEVVMEQVGELILKLQQRSEIKSLPIFGIGISICGIVNRHTGNVDYAPVFGWKNKDIKSALKKYTKLNIEMGNVPHLIALGELLYGIGKNYKDFVCIKLGYGIGSGIIIDGRPFYGADGYAGELGHIVVDRFSKYKGLVGVKGTLETVASWYGIMDVFLDHLKDGEISVLNDMDISNLNVEKIMEAAINGDKLAIEVIDSATSFIGMVIDTLVKLLNTKAIVLAGDLTLHSDYLIDKIRGKIKNFTTPGISEDVPIFTSSFQDDAALMGAFSIILEKVMQLKYI